MQQNEAKTVLLLLGYRKGYFGNKDQYYYTNGKHTVFFKEDIICTDKKLKKHQFYMAPPGGGSEGQKSFSTYSALINYVQANGT